MKINNLIATVLLMVSVVVPTANAQIFYKVSGKSLDKPSFLFGTHHLAPLSILDSVPGVIKSLADVNAVVGEIDMLSLNQMQMAMKMQPYMMAPADSTLDKVLTPAIYNKVDSALRQLAGMHLEMFNPMKPMVPQTVVISAIIIRELPEFDSAGQLDLYMQKLGKESGKEIKGLESVERQAEILYNSQNIRKQADALVKLFEDTDKSINDARQLNDAYMHRDLKELYELTLKEEDEDGFLDALLTRRNRQWMEEIPGIISTTPSIIVVGALHLAGPDGLVSLLRNAGYTVEPVE